MTKESILCRLGAAKLLAAASGFTHTEKALADLIAQMDGTASRETQRSCQAPVIQLQSGVDIAP